MDAWTCPEGLSECGVPPSVHIPAWPHPSEAEGRRTSCDRVQDETTSPASHPPSPGCRQGNRIKRLLGLKEPQIACFRAFRSKCTYFRRSKLDLEPIHPADVASSQGGWALSQAQSDGVGRCVVDAVALGMQTAPTTVGAFFACGRAGVSAQGRSVESPTCSPPPAPRFSPLPPLNAHAPTPSRVRQILSLMGHVP